MIEKSYRIWTAPRTGHTLLARLLADTGVAGTPGEHLTLHNESNMKEKYGVSTFEEMVEAIQKACSGGSIVAGCKMDSYRDRHQMLKEELLELRGIESENEEIDLWKIIFPNCKDIFLSRRNKVRQAVSWWRAIQDNEWHVSSGNERSNIDPELSGKYDFDAILHLWKETMLREANMQDYFTKYGIQPLNLVYEDYILDLPGTIQSILDHLEIQNDYIFPEIKFRRTADAISEQWVERFKEDLQKGWKEKSY